MDDLLRTANKGEWSELYVFFKIMLDRVLYAANEDLVPKSDEWFKFVKLYRSSRLGAFYEYDLSQPGVVTVWDGTSNIVITTENLSQKTQSILERIKTEKATFAVHDASSLMSEYGIKSVKAASASKTDIDAEVLVSNTPTTRRMGFSVKSYVGGAPTLVNPSSHTNFVFEVSGFTGDIQEVNEIEGRSKVRDRINMIVKSGGVLSYKGMTSDTFKRNLRFQDSIYPATLAEMLLNFYSGKGNDFVTLGKLVSESSVNDLNESEVRVMTKRYLRSSALGMVPATIWSESLSTQGGYIVVLETGELVCYSLYFVDDFENYLYLNTRFDTPSTTRYKFGKLYEREGGLFFDLNLQVRFK